ncbi:hypothetical protein CULT_210063 [[Clostridium] ultunense Esp]|nr:hypothetical protein CULT_210063 [[Clostridium] ultunense Esp]
MKEGRKIGTTSRHYDPFHIAWGLPPRKGIGRRNWYNPHPQNRCTVDWVYSTTGRHRKPLFVDRMSTCSPLHPFSSQSIHRAVGLPPASSGSRLAADTLALVRQACAASPAADLRRQVNAHAERTRKNLIRRG